MATIFTKIINGEIPSYKIAEDDNFFAFMDISPLAKGHTLVIPKKEVDNIIDLSDELHAGLWNFAKKIGKAVGNVVPCKKVGFTVIGLEVAHAHIHVIPINTIYDMDFKKAKLKLEQNEFIDLASKISTAFYGL